MGADTAVGHGVPIHTSQLHGDLCAGDDRGGGEVRLSNEQGQAVYYNVVDKHGVPRYQVQAASGQVLKGRDGQKQKTRSFVWEHQAEAWLKRNGYTVR